MLDEEIFWHSGYSNPQTLDAAKAEAIAQWGAGRRDKILAWAGTAEDEQLRAAADKLLRNMSKRWQRQALAPEAKAGSEPIISKKVAAQRTLFSRRVLAAWEFLLALNERPALARLRELTALERTPLPR